MAGKTISIFPADLKNSNEQIDGIDLTYQNDFPFQEIFIQDNFSFEEKILSYYTTQNAILIHVETADKTMAILRTANLQTSTGIGLKSTYQQIKKTYPSVNTKVVNHAKGYYLVLPTRKLLFNMNAQNQVMEWGVYEVY